MNKKYLNHFIIKKIEQGFQKIEPYNNNKFKTRTLNLIKKWLNKKKIDFNHYYSISLIEKKEWSKLFECFYKKINFGTGGKRGLMGIGLNRINTNTSEKSAQGFSQYLAKRFGNIAFKQGVTVAYDIRNKSIFSYNKAKRLTAIYNISSLKLAKTASKKYYENEIKMYIFSTIRSTPKLSFSIRYLKTLGGCIFTASHNNLNYNGEKFYNHFGNQFIPPHDKILSYEISNNLIKKNKIKKSYINYSYFINFINNKIDQVYFNEVKLLNILKKQNIKILYSSLHGTGITSIFYFFLKLKLDIYLEDKTSNLSGQFENTNLNFPNPEFYFSFNNFKKKANLLGIDIIINTDSDADRLGLMVKHKKQWIFLNGNQIATISSMFISSNTNRFKNNPYKKYLIIKTLVTTSIINKIAKNRNIHCIKNIPVGFKYISEILKILERNGLENNFLLGSEESHGFIAGIHCKDKDSISIAIFISELTIILKRINISFIDYLNLIYSKFGYHINQLIEFNHLGYEKNYQSKKIIKYFKKNNFNKIGDFIVNIKINKINKILFFTKKKSFEKIIIFDFKELGIIKSTKLFIRASGTEPKLKMYIEISTYPIPLFLVKKNRNHLNKIIKTLEKDLIKHYHKALN